ncbi:MAG: hypothetical protein ACI89U_000024 [Gammaproteobacteria bacterium]|jgi:hypothetical protein
MYRLREIRKTLLFFRNIFAIQCVVFVSACQSPHVLFHDKTVELNLTSEIIKTSLFSHKIYKNNRESNGKLHVYIAGDGLPWMAGVIPSKDPTPRKPLVLSLIKQDMSAALILGRPCYHGLANNPVCDSSLWTNKRYSSMIVDSMEKAIEQLSQHYQDPDVVLMGYSGGGTLAVLLAERIPYVTGVVTIGANLNTEAWTQYHQLLPLSGSINPVDRPSLPAEMLQKHYVGRYDKVMPASLVETYTRNHVSSELVIVDDFNHRCCWEKIWTQIISDIP